MKPEQLEMEKAGIELNRRQRRGPRCAIATALSCQPDLGAVRLDGHGRGDGRHQLSHGKDAPELGKHVGQDDGTGWIVIRHKISRSDLAAIAGVARENVSRVMSDRKQNQVITRSSGLYCLSKIATLKRDMDAQVEALRTAGNTKNDYLVGPSRELNSPNMAQRI
jgi:hypothetical protein